MCDERHKIFANAIDRDSLKEGLGQVDYPTNQAGQAYRDPISEVLYKEAQSLRQRANELDNLGKMVAILPKEMEATLYPIIMEHILNNNNSNGTKRRY